MSTTGGTAQGTVLVLDEPDVIRKKFKTAVTDSGREIRYVPDEKPGVSNLIEILSVATGRSIPEVERATTGKGYGELKGDVGEAVVELFAPMQERYGELRADEGELRRLLRVGAEKAREASAPTLREMYERWGSSRPELAPSARLQPVDAEAGVAAAVEPQHRVADRLEHPLDLAVAALVQRQLDRGGRPPHGRGRGRAVLELDAVGELPQDPLGRLRPRPRRRTPCRPRSADARAGARARRRWSAAARRSCRRRAGRRGRRAPDARRGRRPSAVPAGRARS